jgi:hypothetical protein
VLFLFLEREGMIQFKIQKKIVWLIVPCKFTEL